MGIKCIENVDTPVSKIDSLKRKIAQISRLFQSMPVFHFWPEGCNAINHIATGHGGRDNCGHHVSASIFLAAP